MVTMSELKIILLNYMIELQMYLDFEEIFLLVFRYKMLDTLFEFAESLELKD